MEGEARMLMVLLPHDRSNKRKWIVRRSCGEDILIHNSGIYGKVMVTPVLDGGLQRNE